MPLFFDHWTARLFTSQSICSATAAFFTAIRSSILSVSLIFLSYKKALIYSAINDIPRKHLINSIFTVCIKIRINSAFGEYLDPFIIIKIFIPRIEHKALP